MDVNVLSMFLTCRAVVPRMASGGGRIVNISSGTPFRGVPLLLHYVTSKGAIVAFTRALAKELGGEILVNCVAPGFTMSDGVEEHPEVVEALQRGLGRRRARSSATRCPRTSPARSRSCAARSPRSSPARPWSSTEASTSIETLALHQGGAERRRGAEHRLPTSSRTATHARLDARRGDAPDGALLSAEVDLAATGRGSCAGPHRLRARAASPTGTRTRARGSATCCSARSRSTREGEQHTYGPGEPWFERGPDPVLATDAADEPSAFVRVLLAAGGVGGQADDQLRRPGRRGEAEDPAPDGLPRAAGRGGDAHAAGRSSSTSSSCTAPTLAFGVPGESYLPCSTRCTTRRCG